MASGLFDRYNILGILDHTNKTLVATRIRTDVAKLLIRKIMANTAKNHALAKLFDELPERESFFFFRF